MRRKKFCCPFNVDWRMYLDFQSGSFPKLSRTYLNSSKLIWTYPNLTEHIRTSPNLFILIWTNIHIFKLFQTYLNLSKLIQTDPVLTYGYLSKHFRTYPNIFELIQTYSSIFEETLELIGAAEMREHRGFAWENIINATFWSIMIPNVFP